MKSGFFVFSILSLLFMSSGCHSGKEKVRIFDYSYREVLKKAREEAFFYHARNFVPGSSVAVSIKGKLVWSEGIGQANQDLEVPATRNTRYRIGQITEVLTSIAYYQLVEKGKLSPDDDFRKYLPEFPEKKYQVRLKNLASQTSGIRPPREEAADIQGFNLSFQKVIQNVYPDSLLFPPGMYQYPTFFAYNILGEVLEKVTGENFNRIVTRNVTDTLKMSHTCPDNPFITIKGRSAFYDRNIVAQVVNAISMDLRYKLPAEGYLSTAEDLVKLGNALLSSPVLSDSVRHWMLTPPVNKEDFQAHWGNGLMTLRIPGTGVPFYAARGLLKSSGAMLVIIPEEKIVVAWLSNLSDELDELPGLKIAMMFRDYLHGNFEKKPAAAGQSDTLKTK
jgi:serine beta-lactamase-like protein LACTB, mitochondrial